MVSALSHRQAYCNNHSRSTKGIQFDWQVVDIVTDNAANMVKAFRLLPDMCHEPEEYNVDKDDNSHTVNDIEIINVQQALEVSSVAIDEASEESEDDDDSQIQSATVKLVLQHKRCANHTLNLVASMDSMSARDNSVKYKRSYDRVMGKVQALSNAVQRSTKNADEVEDTILLTFLNPTITH